MSGGGFAGVAAAQALRNAPARITVVDSRNHYLFQPLLYQVATAGLNTGDIAVPIREILKRQKNGSVILARATSFDTTHRRVILADGELAYDRLIVATGASHSYFGHDEWAKYAPGLKTLENALEIRRRVLFAFEEAERETDADRRRALMNFVVVGGGPTGVELAGALAELARYTLVGEFRHIDPRDARVILFEGADRILAPFPEESSKQAKRQLEKIGVEVRTSAIVTHLDERGVTIGGEFVPAATILWAAGVAASPLCHSLDAPRDRAGRIMVEPDLTVPGHSDIFVIGDIASVKQENGKPVPGVAPAALQMGRHAALNIKESLAGRPHRAFKYWDKGSVATIGRSAAVAAVGRVKLSGFLAWMTWLVIHLFFLIGFRNRLLVLMSLAWSYFTYQRDALLITDRVDQPVLAPREVAIHTAEANQSTTGAQAGKPASAPEAGP